LNRAISGLDRARHELGHHFIGRDVGFEMGEVSIDPPKGNLVYLGGTSKLDTSRPITSLVDFERWCEDRVMVLRAGVMAQALKNGTVDNQLAIDLNKEVSGFVDHMMASQLLNLLRNVRYHDRNPADAQTAMEADEERIWLATVKLVASYATEIEGVAVDLLGSPKLSKEEFEDHPLVKARFP
jgi:hypothetical protein